MKNIIRTIAVVAAAAISLASCTKEGPSLFKGNYSFKTSGTVTLGIDSTTIGTRIDIADIDLTVEQGQMDIAETSSRGGNTVITMNILAGNVYVIGATADGSKLTLVPFKRDIAVYTSLLGSVTIPVEVSGTAEKVGNSIIFDLVYSGKTENSSALITVTESSVKCVAKLNE